MNLEEVDKLLTELSEKYHVPKPNYCVYQYKLIKPPIEVTDSKVSIKITPMRPFISGTYIPFGEGGYITLTCGTKGNISMNTVLHEFYHYKTHVDRGYKPYKGENEEKKARSFARKEMKTLRGNRLMICENCGKQVLYKDGTRNPFVKGHPFHCDNCCKEQLRRELSLTAKQWKDYWLAK